MKNLEEIIQKLADSEPHTEEYKIAGEIKQFIDNKKSKKIRDKVLLEYYAFSYFEETTENLSSWGMYFGPAISGTRDDGEVVEFPPFSSVNSDSLEYYKQRANESRNPVMVNRYSNLVLDFNKKLGRKLDVKYYQLAIKSAINICNKADLHGVILVEKMKRAISLAKEISDKKLLRLLKTTSLKLENKIAEDDKPGLWGFTVQYFLFENNLLTEKEIKKIVKVYEERLERLLKIDRPYFTQVQIQLLLDYRYKHEQDCSAVLELLEKLHSAYMNSKSMNDHPLRILHYLEEIKNISSRYRDCEGVKEFTKKIESEILNFDPDWGEHLQNIETKVNIDQKKVKNFIDNIFSGDLERVIPRFTVSFIQKVGQVETQLENLKSRFPMQYMASRNIIGNNGKVIAVSSPSTNSDIDFYNLYSQNSGIQEYFLSIAFDRLLSDFSEADISSYIIDSDLIDKEQKPYVKRLLKHFFNKNYIEFQALTIPFIEKSFRKLCNLNNELVNEPDQFWGGYKYRTLHKLLDSPSLVNTFKGIGGQDVVTYLKFILTIKIGLNLRNDFSHGENLQYLNKSTANRLLHVLFILSLLKIKSR